MQAHNSRTKLYLLLALIGLIASWIYNIRYLLEGGSIAPVPFFTAAFANPLTTAITIDVYCAALVFCIWLSGETRRLQMRRAWTYMLVCFSIGLAVALPLFLAMRERALARR